MSDLETRLTEALEHRAQDAPGAIGLAVAARARAGRRRRARLAGLAAVVALAIGVPTAMLAWPDPGRGGNTSTRGPSIASDPNVESGDGTPSGYRVESWHGVSVDVPNTWGYGSLSDWCANDGTTDRPRVERPGVVLDILCTPRTTYGLSFAPADGGGAQWPVAPQHSESWPDGAFVGATTVGDVVVTVAAREITVAQYVLDSATQIIDVDANGCGAGIETDPRPPAGGMSVCRYDSAGALEQSELLTGPDVDAATAAIRAAPESACSRPAGASAAVVLMWSSEVQERVDLAGGCARLTSDVLYWALSPGWSGGVDGTVPLPPELRSQ